ncbi:hypothetical protein N7447_004190 [Penicillium robsamsonii]|uniref:uncharacterized protein n=1 Tax=Penicillium robsamsonii TaxID=1792511 RepID=UPI002546F93E|nr:uncharacterized protein N7447_004190 [Penicillium robsamsonii]KAJ5827427.1 hypothetical protein N7447_004190 [Penicillium robsamsonii]
MADSIAAVDSVYSADRHYYMQLLERQVMELRAHPDLRTRVLDGLRELSLLTPGCIEAALVTGDAVFHQLCSTIKPYILAAIATLSEDNADPASGLMVADQLEKVVPWDIRDPLTFGGPPTWRSS